MIVDSELIDVLISIHALREEGDAVFASTPPKVFLFQSTPSARRATLLWEHFENMFGISIHALREEGDYNHRQGIAEYRKFQSTPSARRATAQRRKSRVVVRISIHALREEGDL